MTSRPDSHELRAMIRELIGESLHALSGSSRDASAHAETRTVRLDTDDDVSAFVRAIIALLDDAEQAQRLRSGAIRFHLASASSSNAGLDDESGCSQSSPAVRIDRGAVTEKIVTAAAADKRSIIVSTRAVITPLGREKARKLGVEIIKEA